MGSQRIRLDQVTHTFTFWITASLDCNSLNKNSLLSCLSCPHSSRPRPRNQGSLCHPWAIPMRSNLSGLARRQGPGDFSRAAHSDLRQIPHRAGGGMRVACWGNPLSQCSSVSWGLCSQAALICPGEGVETDLMNRNRLK